MQISIKNRNYFALSAVSFLHLFAWSAAMSFFAIWLGQHLGIGATKTGLLYSANALAALCMQPVLGFISDKIGLKKHCYLLF
ncbi:LacY proton/sugar symporter [Megamonas hypermegale ART12/1]|nr:LacY proton/sugar symporter [Megamonas hypermegale ART12/1]